MYRSVTTDLHVDGWMSGEVKGAQSSPWNEADWRTAASEDWREDHGAPRALGRARGCVGYCLCVGDRRWPCLSFAVRSSSRAGSDRTMIYGSYELSINLGSDFRPGVTYQVSVNARMTAFVAQ
jgi:hypothetical protein